MILTFLLLKRLSPPTLSASTSPSSPPSLPILSVTMNSEVKGNNTVSEVKPPTRLQKQAPATLQFSEITNNEVWNSSRTVIPLLSPLVLSPNSLPDSTGQTQNSFLAPNNNNNHEAKMNLEIAIGMNPEGGGGARNSGWRHPAMAGPTADTSSLYAYFQSQCVLLPRNQ
ncbi:hypothetical protein LXL04_036400 [Taraxacum kok-saghyz]